MAITGRFREECEAAPEAAQAGQEEHSRLQKCSLFGSEGEAEVPAWHWPGALCPCGASALSQVPQLLLADLQGPKGGKCKVQPPKQPWMFCCLLVRGIVPSCGEMEQCEGEFGVEMSSLGMYLVQFWFHVEL